MCLIYVYHVYTFRISTNKESSVINTITVEVLMLSEPSLFIENNYDSNNNNLDDDNKDIVIENTNNFLLIPK